MKEFLHPCQRRLPAEDGYSGEPAEKPSGIKNRVNAAEAVQIQPSCSLRSAMLTISSVIYLVALCNLLCRLMASLPLYSPRSELHLCVYAFPAQGGRGEEGSISRWSVLTVDRRSCFPACWIRTGRFIFDVPKVGPACSVSSISCDASIHSWSLCP